MFKSVVAVVFQNIFYLEKYQNNIFKKIIIFNISTSKQFKNTKKKLNLK
jgi:hypothetical protein